MLRQDLYVATNNEIIVVKKEGNCVSYEPVNIKNYFGMEGSGMSGGAVKGEKALSHSFLMDTLRKLMGRTLTIIDASVHEKTQNKAIKDLIRNIYSDEMEFSAGMAFDQKELDKMIPEDIDPETLGEVSIEEALGVE